MKHERFIINNRSSKLMYEVYQMAFDCYFEHWSEEEPNYTLTSDTLDFVVITNAKSITINIYDKKIKQL